MPGTLRRVVRGISLSIAVAGLTGAVVFIVAYLLYPVTGIQVKGARMYPESEVSQSLSDGASLLTLNTAMLRRQVETNPWVESAKVTKQWQSGIVIVQVKERRAVLDGDLDGRRVILAVDGTELPGLGGARLGRVKVDEDQVEEILRAGRSLESHGIALQSVDDVNAGGTEATVEGRRIIFADRLADDQIEALPEIMRSNPRAPLFDLRSPGRVVVSYEDPPSSRDGGTSG
ncbi:MAG TPA: FtsQ-type POTRA domain-containing protein [Rubrobacteraceae bacterium]|nr:FtsQ-type POTRA domain-containing protein [Rubrobacteraceae bacterium]